MWLKIDTPVVVSNKQPRKDIGTRFNPKEVVFVVDLFILALLLVVVAI
jgi:hypothetical protein